MEREVQWKREDIEDWKGKREAKRLEEEEKLQPKVEERDALQKELQSVEEKIRSMEAEAESVDADIGGCLEWSGSRLVPLESFWGFERESFPIAVYLWPFLSTMDVIMT